jgi:hypothetical protein
MDPRRVGRRDLALLATCVVGLTRVAEGPLLWAAVALLLVGVALATLQVIGEGEPRGVPIESLLLPAVAAVGAAGAIRLVPVGLFLVPALALTWLLVERSVALETRLASAVGLPGPEDRARVRSLALILAFVAFTGVAATVPGALVLPGAESPEPLTGGGVAVLAAVDALVAFLLGYRVVALRVTSVRDAALSAVTYAVVVAIAAGAARALALPLLVGPALLTLVFFLWDTLHGTAPARRRDPRWLWEVVLLALLGVLVIGLNLRLDG